MPRFMVELAVTVDDPNPTDEQAKDLSEYIQVEVLEHEESVSGLASFDVKAGEEWLVRWLSPQPDLLTAAIRGIELARGACRKRGVTTLRIVAITCREFDVE
jgi:hypothetical protein